VDEPLALITPTQKYYYHANHLYSVAALTNNVGAVVERYRYDAYGQRIVLAADGITTRTASNYGQQVGLTGRYLDAEPGLWYFRTRYEDPQLGRFINRMPWSMLVDGVAAAYSFEVVDSEILEIGLEVFEESEGGYLQGRYGLYDFMANDPANTLEPYSWGLVGRAVVGGARWAWRRLFGPRPPPPPVKPPVPPAPKPPAPKPPKQPDDLVIRTCVYNCPSPCTSPWEWIIGMKRNEHCPKALPRNCATFVCDKDGNLSEQSFPRVCALVNEK